MKALIAYKAIKAMLNNEDYKPVITNDLKKKQRVFVTLTINNQLRGCIGFLKPLPLWKGVPSAAVSAANDPRFQPLTRKELSRITIKVSTLTTPVKTTINEIRSGDGVILKCEGREALFLPEVWKELPNKEEFLKQLCLKAGLNIDCYKKATLFKFKTESEELKPQKP